MGSVPRGAGRGPGPCRGGRSRRASSGARARRARPPPLTDSAPAREQLLSRNVKRFRGGLVPQAHRLLYYSTLGSRVVKRNRSPPPLTDSAPARVRQQVTSLQRSGEAPLISALDKPGAVHTVWPWEVDVRLREKGNSKSHGARPVHLIITMIKWIRTSRLSIRRLWRGRECGGRTAWEGRGSATSGGYGMRVPPPRVHRY